MLPLFFDYIELALAGYSLPQSLISTTSLPLIVCAHGFKFSPMGWLKALGTELEMSSVCYSQRRTNNMTKSR